MILRTPFRWAKHWTLGGLVIGILMMLTKTPPYAESGGSAGDILDYAAWIPVAGVVGLLAGLVIGFVYAGLMALTRTRRQPYEARPSAFARLMPRVLCAAVAGFVVTAPLLGPAGALIFAGFAVCTALIMTVRDAGRAATRQ